jgi:hypothetical protein
MGFFSRLLGVESRKPSPPVAAPAAQLRTETRTQDRKPGIRYDPTLIGSLKEDHATLFRLYGELVHAKDSGNFSSVPRLLGEFKFALQTHVMVENVRFYVFLQQQLVGDADTSAFVDDVRKQMDGIARAAVQFANTYAVAEPFTPELARGFSADLAAIGDVLTKRVAMEESRLYPLYSDYRPG